MKVYSSNFLFVNYKKCYESYQNTGAFILEGVFSSIEVRDIRKKIEDLYFTNKNDDNRIRKIEDIPLNELSHYLNVFLNNELVKVFKKIFSYGNKLTPFILPPMHIAKNYLPHSKYTIAGGWHRDCGGELQYNKCKQLINSDNYLFGKIGIYLQDNSEYGGGINIIPGSNKDSLALRSYSFSSIGVKILKLVQKFSKHFHYFLNRNRLFNKIFKMQKLNINAGDVVFFDSRIWHRGTYANKIIEPKLEYSIKNIEAKLPEDKQKYVLYSHFGNITGIQSYLYERNLRQINQRKSESVSWKDELKIIKSLYKNIDNVLMDEADIK